MRAIVTAIFCAVLGTGFVRADNAGAFFDDTAVREIRLTFEDTNWYNTLYEAHARNPEDPYFPAKFQYGTTVIDRIGARFKGNSSFQRNGIKKPFKLDFNEYDTNVNFLGLKKLNLNNGDLQPDFLREKLLHDFAGKFVAALRSVFVKLYINDTYYGLYLAVEQPDKVMMQSRYGDNEAGNLFEAAEQLGARATPNLSYLGSSPSAYQGTYLLKTNETANDYSDLIEFLDVLNNTATADLPSRLEPICDVENWLYGMAVNNLFVNLDSYLGVGAEYYLYDRSSDGRFVHIQWDHNESFGTTGDGTPRIANPFATDPFYLPTSGGGGFPGGGGGFPGGGGGTVPARPLLQKLWAVDGYKRLYLRALARFLREGFNSTMMEARVTQLADLIRSDVYADPNKTYTNAQFETALNTQVGGGQGGGGGMPGGGATIYGVNQFVRERYNVLRPLLDSMALPSDVRLNELMSINAGVLKDGAGDADPWIELHNLGPGPVDLAGMYLTDDAANSTKWALPSRRLADGEYLVLWLDGETVEGNDHASLRLQPGGGKLYLYSASGGTQTKIDEVTYGALAANQSLIRLGSLGSRWATTDRVTAGAVNPTQGNSVVAGTGLLRINELMADNKRTLEDPAEKGAFEDWFEIHNPGATAVDMSGMYLTDNLGNPVKWQVPQGVSIPPGGYLLFWADNDPSQGPAHTNFQLDASPGEDIGLFQSDGTTLIDSVSYKTQQPDISFGRTPGGGSAWTIFKPATPGAPNASPYAEWVMNAASSLPGPVAPGSIAAAYGQNLAPATTAAQTRTLPTTLAGTSVEVTDRSGVTRAAPLVFVSSGQVNFVVPSGTSEGVAKVAIRSQGATVRSGDILVEAVAPGLFSADATGQGVGLIAAVSIDAAGIQTPVPVYVYDSAQQRVVSVPISLSGDPVYLVLYGTGIQGVRDLSTVSVQAGNEDVPVQYAAAQGEYTGLDQINVGPLPRKLAGAGEVRIEVRIGDFRANRVAVTMR